jgi:hypothetical protein
VQHRSILGDVDVLATEHRIAPLLQPALLRQRNQQLQRAVVDAVFRVVEEQAGTLGRHPLAAAGVGREQLAQVRSHDLAVVLAERLPAGAVAKR